MQHDVPKGMLEGEEKVRAFPDTLPSYEDCVSFEQCRKKRRERKVCTKYLHFYFHLLGSSSFSLSLGFASALFVSFVRCVSRRGSTVSWDPVVAG